MVSSPVSFVNITSPRISPQFKQINGHMLHCIQTHKAHHNSLTWKINEQTHLVALVSPLSRVRLLTKDFQRPKITQSLLVCGSLNGAELQMLLDGSV